MINSVLGTLCLITDRRLCPGRDLTGPVGRALEAGVRLVQLREKDLSGRELLDTALKLRYLTSNCGARLIVNDRVDVAMLAKADGVHLGQTGFSPGEVRRIIKRPFLIGVSAHSIEEARGAQIHGADYITFGPIYHTPSKEAYGPPLGVELLKKAALTVKIPVFAIGGVKKGLIKELREAGAHGVAVISAILGTKDPKENAKELLEELSTANMEPYANQKINHKERS